jgi:hypothetical protein
VEKIRRRVSRRIRNVAQSREEKEIIDANPDLGLLCVALRYSAYLCVKLFKLFDTLTCAHGAGSDEGEFDPGC